ncbi:MAG: hypothetical protein H8E43_03985 [Planctomycetia bacterium]|nr:hypothetical protein [Planctomycetia bacterium]MBL6915833.1 hypothetical protein [Planctomycetota bacterium]
MVTSHTPDSSEGIHVDADYCADADDCAAADDCKELLDSPKNTILGEIPSFSLCFRDRSRSRRSTFFTDISSFRHFVISPISLLFPADSRVGIATSR